MRPRGQLGSIESVAGDEEDRNLWMCLSDSVRQTHTVEDRHAYVRHHGSDLIPISEKFERLCSVSRFEDIESTQTEHVSGCQASERLVVDHEYRVL